ncbi:MAG: glycyl-radical enzyme activating protein [Synergistaceae bacterium]|nr:glycyl-radical enzyme activating protein [Synergistaceae bacterium]
MVRRGRVLRFERSSNKDGFGLRTVVFFKGCPLKCAWCSTPESQSIAYEAAFLRSACLRCGRCESACPEGIIYKSEGGTMRAKSGCSGCSACVDACPHDAVRLYGREMTAGEVMEEIQKDSIFFHHGGGVTLSGGEVLMQPEFALEILTLCRESGIDAAIESCGFAGWEAVAPLLDYLNGIFIDVKIMDGAKHRRYTGADNAAILDNILRIDASGKTKITIRTPFIPTVNDDVENYESMASFCERLHNLSAVEILPYHRLGIETYRNLGREAPFPDLLPPSREEIEAAVFPLERLKNVALRIG